ncbi:hypothetical protein [Jejuia pallidilutea]|jgi:fucose permease|uniref:Uncharacterized protein n=1 Tax=Jejuia pallidilutea TaxID=504487 RepID=A0A090VR32_9FLAO|nr:hypothetical protein JCM19301_1788 [Jejuia pallidilutea]GAL70822.1 hypothetical protein JCM19302_1985 [Jejuia pallidilutea]GAL89812.1 hypothetical protein JCM19538_3289 [Jejuia pallidilutea]
MTSLFAFYGGYTTMAIPAALFVRKYSYKKVFYWGLGFTRLAHYYFMWQLVTRYSGSF